MALKKDKQKVLGEFFDDERIKTFLEYDDTESPNSKVSLDFYLLERAYRGMISDNFASFVEFFKAAGKDVNGTNQHGETFLQSIRQHKQAEEYILALETSGAQ